MIKVGTLCWLVHLDHDIAEFNGRVVEIVGPLSWRADGRGGMLCYLVDAPWLAALRARTPNAHSHSYCAPRFLQPFSDPDKSNELCRHHEGVA